MEQPITVMLFESLVLPQMGRERDFYFQDGPDKLNKLKSFIFS